MNTRLLALAAASGRILEVNLDDGSVDVLVAEAGDAPDGIVVADRIYWTTMGRPSPSRSGLSGDAGLDFSAADGGLHSASLAGEDRRDVLPHGAVTTGKQVTASGGRLYWSDREGLRVGRVGTDGTGFELLVVNQAKPDALAECVGVAVDESQTSLYWTQKGPSKGGRGRILRARIDGALPVIPDQIETLWDGLPEPIDLELADGWLYWTDRGASPAGNTLNRARVPSPGAAGDSPNVLAAGFAEAIGLAVDHEALVVYVSDLSGTIRAVPLPGSSEVERIVAQVGEPLTGIALGRIEEQP